MALFTEDGTPVYNDGFPTTPDTDPLVVVTENVYQEQPFSDFGGGADGVTRRLLVRKGEVIRTSAADRFAALGDANPGA